MKIEKLHQAPHRQRLVPFVVLLTALHGKSLEKTLTGRIGRSKRQHLSSDELRQWVSVYDVVGAMSSLYETRQIADRSTWSRARLIKLSRVC
jgi:hypothetical protein